MIEGDVRLDEASGFYWEQVRAGSHGLSPVILLHGSGGDERSLVEFGLRSVPDRALIAVRGGVGWEEGYAFFRRNPDRSIDHGDLSARCAEFCEFLEHLGDKGYRKPLLLGFSNGAIMAAAVAVRAPSLSSGIALLRPLSPWAEASFPSLERYPVLIVGGAHDARRHPSDAIHLAEQFRQAGALVIERTLPVGHGLEEADCHLVCNWLADLVDQE